MQGQQHGTHHRIRDGKKTDEKDQEEKLLGYVRGAHCCFTLGAFEGVPSCPANAASMNELPRVTSSQTRFTGKVFSVRSDQVQIGDRTSTVDVVEHVGAYAIIAQPSEDEVVLVRQYRHPLRECLIELPAGSSDGSEAPAAGAARELAEETGYRAGAMNALFSIAMAPGFCTEVITFFHATELTPGATAFDEDEDLDTLCVSVDKALAMLHDGTIKDAKTWIGLRWLYGRRSQQFR